jgi:hypothetical protein
MKALSFFFLLIMHFFAILALMPIPVLAAEGSIGVTPKSIRVNGILAGSTHVSSFKVMSTGFETFAVIDGPISNWLHVEKTEFGYDVRIVVPADASTGMYTATILVRPDTNSTAILAAKLALPVIVYVNVSDEVMLNPVLKKARTYVSSNNVVFAVDIANLGNVPVHIQRANYTILDAGGRLVGSGILSNDAPIGEFSRTEIYLQPDFRPNPGQYNAILEIDIDGYVFKEAMPFDMPVLPLHLRLLDLLKGVMR